MVISERNKVGIEPKTRLVTEGEELAAFARSLGAEIYGVAAAEAFKEFPKKPQPSKFVPDAKSVIIVGMPNTPELYDTAAKPELAEIFRKESDNVARSEKSMGRPPAGAERFYFGEETALLGHEVGMLGYKIAWKLHKEGYQAFYFAKPTQQEARFRTAAFYFTPAMYLAGIGQMGFNCSTLTAEYGPRILVTAIITNKGLPAGQPFATPYYEDCKSCLECVKRCPSQALDGRGWKNVFKCSSYGCCGTCLAVCPVGSIK